MKKQCLCASVCVFSAMLAARVQGWQCLPANWDISPQQFVEIHRPQRKNPYDFGDTLTFP